MSGGRGGEREGTEEGRARDGRVEGEKRRGRERLKERKGKERDEAYREFWIGCIKGQVRQWEGREERDEEKRREGRKEWCAGVRLPPRRLNTQQSMHSRRLP